MDQSTFLLTLALLHLAQATDCQGDKCTGYFFYPEFNHRPRPGFIKLSSNYFTQYINIYGYYLCLYLTQLSKAGLIITGGWDTETSIETLGAESNCSIPPFPSPGNQSCSLSWIMIMIFKQKGESSTPSL